VPCARAIEDLVVERGVREYVMLGAGLDTFAQRRPETARFTPPRITGGRVEHDKKVFSRRFAEYAMACSGRKLEDLGAALYSMMFGQIDLEEYSRLRRRDERGAKSKSAPKRAKRGHG
jgi:hypothetical protein